MLKSMEKQELLFKMVLGKWPAICKSIKLCLIPNTNGSTSQMFFKNEIIRRIYGIIIFVDFFNVVIAYKLAVGKTFVSKKMTNFIIKIKVSHDKYF